jgi:hypothetical protein
MKATVDKQKVKQGYFNLLLTGVLLSGVVMVSVVAMIGVTLST